MKEAFITKRFTYSSLAMIDQVNQILMEMSAKGYTLTLRQLYYQLVSRDLIPNNLKSYKNLGSLVSDARQAGMIDWEYLEDRNRSTKGNQHWDNPAQIVKAAYNSYRIDKWAGQPWHIEVMVEKDALSGVLDPVCRRLDISYTANKGYSSSSTMYEIGKRLAQKFFQEGKKVMMIYLGDHDPSGIDMTRDVMERLRMYADVDDIEVERIALNMDQIRLWNPPENPAKETDSRADGYIAQFGYSSWELDAVRPEDIDELITTLVLDLRVADLWDAAVRKEQHERAALLKFANTWKGA
jgi:hypothetical protein